MHKQLPQISKVYFMLMKLVLSNSASRLLHDVSFCRLRHTEHGTYLKSISLAKRAQLWWTLVLKASVWKLHTSIPFIFHQQRQVTQPSNFNEVSSTIFSQRGASNSVDIILYGNNIIIFIEDFLYTKHQARCQYTDCPI